MMFTVLSASQAAQNVRNASPSETKECQMLQSEDAMSDCHFSQNDSGDYQDYYDGAIESKQNGSQDIESHFVKPPIFYQPPQPRDENWTADWYSIFDERTRRHERDCHSHYEYKNFIIDPARYSPEEYRQRREERRKKWKAGGYLDREDDYHRMNIDDGSLFEAMRWISILDERHGAVKVPFQKKVLYNSKMSKEELGKRLKAGTVATLQYDATKLRRFEGAPNGNIIDTSCITSFSQCHRA